MIKYYLLFLISYIYCSQMVTLLNGNSFHIIYDEKIKYASITKSYYNTQLTIKTESKVEEITKFREKYDIKDSDFLVSPRMYKFEITDLHFKDVMIIFYGEAHKKLFNIKLEYKDDNLCVTKIKIRDHQDDDEFLNMFCTLKYKIMDEIPFAFVLSDMIDEKIRLDKSLEYAETLILFEDIKGFLNSIYGNLKEIYDSAELPIKKMIFDEFKQILFMFDTIRIITRTQYNSLTYETSILEENNSKHTFEYYYLVDITRKLIETKFLEIIENLLNDLRIYFESICLSETKLNLIRLSIADYLSMKCKINLSIDAFAKRDIGQEKFFKEYFFVSDHDYIENFKFLNKFGKIIDNYFDVKIIQYFIQYSIYMEEKCSFLFNEMREIVFDDLEVKPIQLITNIENFLRMELNMKHFSINPSITNTKVVTYDDTFKNLTLEDIVSDLKELKKEIVDKIEEFSRVNGENNKFNRSYINLLKCNYESLCECYDVLMKLYDEYIQYSKYKFAALCLVDIESTK